VSVFEESKSYRPFKYSFAVEAEKKQRIDTYWHEGQIDLTDDLRQYNSKDGLATPNCTHAYNKYVLDTLLLFFTQLDMSVAQGYVELLPHTKNNEIKSLFVQQAAKEVVHQRAYALAGESFGFSDADWVAFEAYKQMRDKIDLMGESFGDLSKPVNYASKLTQVLLGEGIGLFSAFVALLNLKRYGLVIGFNDVNSWSLLDEDLHVKNNIEVLIEIIQELSEKDRQELKERVFLLVSEFVRVEHSLIDLIYEKGELEGIPKQTLKDYITYLGNLRLFQIGYIGTLQVGSNPLKWMDSLLSAERHGAFFEKKITDYTHRKLEGKIDYTKYTSLLN
jgi:ribonucleotide reductase beta subunit family protein with ferritin-like domain